MKTLLSVAASLVAVFSLTSCFQSETTVHLNKDGSGTLVEETLLGAQMIAMMDQMAAGFGGGDAAKQDPVKDMMSEEKAKKRAAELGEGVTFEKAEPVEKNGAKGARVTYKFKDINTIKVSTGDGMKNASPMGDMPGQEEAKKEEPVRFTYADGNLSVKLPKPKADKPKEAEEKPAAENQEMPDLNSPEGQQVKQMFADMKMSLKLVIDPGIAETTATYKDGNTITLMEMNFGKLIENAEGFKKLQSVDQKDPAAAMEALKGIDGVKVETKEEITVKVK